MASDESFTQQVFRDTAKRRWKEAATILDMRGTHRYYDGAVTYALLSAECALKAVLLWDAGCNDATKLPANDDRRTVFKSKRGHDLWVIFTLGQFSFVMFPEESQALTFLRQKNPYAYRYGAVRPAKEDAKPAIEAAEQLLKFMKRVCQ